MSAPTGRACTPAGHDGHCITCGDDGVPMRVIAVDARRGLALCAAAADAGAADADTRSTVEIALVEPVAPGETLLVHAGTALARLEPSQSAESPS